jgi:hypothetical protein
MSWLVPGAPRRQRDSKSWLLVVAGACLLLFVVFVVVSVIVVGAGKSLDVCAKRHGEQATITWHWVPPHPECVWGSGAHESREAVVFDPVTGSFALVLLVVALGAFGWWLVLTVREAEEIAEEKSPR